MWLGDGDGGKEDLRFRAMFQMLESGESPAAPVKSSWKTTVMPLYVGAAHAAARPGKAANRADVWRRMAF